MIRVQFVCDDCRTTISGRDIFVMSEKAIQRGWTLHGIGQMRQYCGNCSAKRNGHTKAGERLKAAQKQETT